MVSLLFTLLSIASTDCPTDFEWNSSIRAKYPTQYRGGLDSALAINCESFLQEKMRIDSIITGDKAGDDPIALPEDYRETFWSRWKENNKDIFSEEDIASFRCSFEGVPSIGTQPMDTSEFIKFAAGFYPSKMREIAIKKWRNKIKFQLSSAKQMTMLRSNWKHEKDAFGQWDYYEYKNILPTRRYVIDLNISNAGAWFSISSNKACFDSDSKLLLLLANGDVVEIQSRSDFNCDGHFNTSYIYSPAITSPIKSIRVDHGTAVVKIDDFSISSSASTIAINQLLMIDSLQVDFYPQNPSP